MVPALRVGADGRWRINVTNRITLGDKIQKWLCMAQKRTLISRPLDIKC